MDYNIIPLNTARNCFRHVIRAFNIKEIYIPYYLCPVMRISAFKEGCKVRFYHINNKFYPSQNFPDDSFILYPNYFGICSENIDKLAKQYKNLIVDNAHSFFSKPCGIASFNSVRKFFPNVRDGAFLYLKSSYNVFYSQSNYVYDYRKMSDREFCLNENRLDCEDIMFMSEASKEYFSNVDKDDIKSFYKNKFNNLVNQYIDINKLNITIAKNSVPYKYPLLCDNIYIADKIAEKYAKCGHEIYRYWENLPDDFPEKIFRENLIAI